MNILQEGQMGKSTFITGAKHWDAITFNGHIMMDALAKHLLGLSTLGMTDVGEVLETYCHLKKVMKKFGLTNGVIWHPD